MDDRFLNANEQTKKFVLSFWTKGFSEIVFPAINEDGANFMGIIYQTNKKTGITYAYQNESYWDKEKKQSREKRKLLGKVDPVTGYNIDSQL